MLVSVFDIVVRPQKLRLFIDYVLQRALAVADHDQKEALIELIKPQLATIRKSSHHHGRHLVASKQFCYICFAVAETVSQLNALYRSVRQQLAAKGPQYQLIRPPPPLLRTLFPLLLPFDAHSSRLFYSWTFAGRSSLQFPQLLFT